MIYEIKLAGAEQDDGKIELPRLALLAQAINDIAKGALQIRLLGVSSKSGKTSEKFTQALIIKLSDVKKGIEQSENTILELECDAFANTLGGQQGNLFYPEQWNELPNQTPVALVMETFRVALNGGEEADYLDKSLVKKLRGFERIFLNSEEQITFSNRGSVPDIKLQKKDFTKLQSLEESIPEPQAMILNGVVDELKFSKLRVTISTKEGVVNGIISDELEPYDISKYWGKEVTLAGTAYYQPNGRMSFLYIERIYEPNEADIYFSKTQKTETVEQQIKKQQAQLKQANHLSDIVGMWPGEESIEEILNSLD